MKRCGENAEGVGSYSSLPAVAEVKGELTWILFWSASWGGRIGGVVELEQNCQPAARESFRAFENRRDDDSYGVRKKFLSFIFRIKVMFRFSIVLVFSLYYFSASQEIPVECFSILKRLFSHWVIHSESLNRNAWRNEIAHKNCRQVVVGNASTRENHTFPIDWLVSSLL